MNSYWSLHPGRVNNSRDLANHLVRAFVGMTLNTGPIPVRPETDPNAQSEVKQIHWGNRKRQEGMTPELTGIHESLVATEMKATR